MFFKNCFLYKMLRMDLFAVCVRVCVYASSPFPAFISSCGVAVGGQ